MAVHLTHPAGDAVLKVDGLAPHYQLEVSTEGNLKTLTVHVEPLGEPVDAAADELAHHIKSNIGVTARVVVGEPGSVPRSQGKAQRVR